ncbi:hypothetical protein RND61_14650 [Streptomyces sp. TRM76323]|uniref:Uncharacterized protein n=1 Tax=Streptomyces tamarix TaxID=3078565 RepID=A0ABU3QLM3_9ACTN|nr:hypothetical protein [Streptomyces tamarix]MDT9683302.1 hypothetical protein [Streptomyces tamarix]
MKSNYVDVRIKTREKADKLLKHLESVGFKTEVEDYELEEAFEESKNVYLTIWSKDGTSDVTIELNHINEEPTMKYRQARSLITVPDAFCYGDD